MFRNRTDGRVSVVKVLIGINVAVFLFTALFGPQGRFWIDSTFGLNPRGASSGMVWQFVSHQFLHANLLHLVVNMLGLWFAGRVLEGLLGGRRFLLLYLACGVIGGIFQLLLTPGGTLIGASGAVCGIIAAFSALYPEMQITALLFFVIPIKMRAKWLGRAIVLVSTLLLITGLAGDIGNAAHLGGALTGYSIVWLGRQGRPKHRQS